MAESSQRPTTGGVARRRRERRLRSWYRHEQHTVRMALAAAQSGAPRSQRTATRAGVGECEMNYTAKDRRNPSPEEAGSSSGSRAAGGGCAAQRRRLRDPPRRPRAAAGGQEEVEDLVLSAFRRIMMDVKAADRDQGKAGAREPSSKGNKMRGRRGGRRNCRRHPPLLSFSWAPGRREGARVRSACGRIRVHPQDAC